MIGVQGDVPESSIDTLFLHQVFMEGLLCVLEKEMATYSSIPAWRITRTEEPGGLLFTGSQGVGHD